MDIKTIVNNTFHERFELPYERLTPDADLRQDLELDSLDYIEMVVFIEKNINIKLNRDELKNVRYLKDVYQLVENSINSLNQNLK